MAFIRAFGGQKKALFYTLKTYFNYIIISFYNFSNIPVFIFTKSSLK